MTLGSQLGTDSSVPGAMEIAGDASSGVAPGASWVPTVQDIADLCPAYTRHPVDGDGVQSGQQQKVFDSTTDPTDVDVQAYIDAAAREVLGRTHVTSGRLDELADLARQTAAWHAAASIEADKQPDGADETTGAYAWKKASYVACLNELIPQARPTLVG